MPLTEAMIRFRSRNDEGATSAEYAGIVAFVALLIVALIAFVPQVGGRIGATAELAICRISQGAGFSDGCAGDPPINYEPPDCMLSSEAASAGGSVTFVVTLGGDTDYDLQLVQHRGDDGKWTSSYLLTTKRTGKVAYKPGAGGGISHGEEETAAGGKVEVEINGSKGTTYEFPTEEEARKGIDAWKSQNDANFLSTHSIDGPVTAESWTIGAKGSLKGKGGNASAEGSLGGVVGLTKNRKNDDTSVSMTMNVAAAVKLGIPMPEGLDAKAGADGALDVGVTATWDKDGHLVAISSLIVGSVQAKGEVGLDTDGAKGSQIGKATVEKLTLPPAVEGAIGQQIRVQLSTNFRDAQGNIDSSAVGPFASALSRYVTMGQMPTAAEAAALREQMNTRSTVTADFYTYDSKKPKYGVEARLGPFAVGAEVHTSSTDRELTSGHYYDFATGSWKERAGCHV